MCGKWRCGGKPGSRSLHLNFPHNVPDPSSKVSLHQLSPNLTKNAQDSKKFSLGPWRSSPNLYLLRVSSNKVCDTFGFWSFPKRGKSVVSCHGCLTPRQQRHCDDLTLMIEKKIIFFQVRWRRRCPSQKLSSPLSVPSPTSPSLSQRSQSDTNYYIILSYKRYKSLHYKKIFCRLQRKRISDKCPKVLLLCNVWEHWSRFETFRVTLRFQISKLLLPAHHPPSIYM